ncbi:MAG TPA: isochorismatase family protein [Candidatus Lustribacter sp.]|jgi:nicotinamidase-related amidase|nr:isochorismatase family protein [Candidatus Lustribacter sp.]
MARVWDAFLTPQDKAVDGARARAHFGFGERPALLLVDLYRAVFGDAPVALPEAMREWPSSCGLAAWDAVPHIQRLLAAARGARIPVFYSTDMDMYRNPLLGWMRSRRNPSTAPESPEMAARRARMNEIIDEVAPIAGELVIAKAAPSAFAGTPLLGQLTARGIDTIIVGGESTSGCVRAAVVDGCTQRFNMIVAEECVFDRTQASHAINLYDMNAKYADVLPVDEIIAHLKAAP